MGIHHYGFAPRRWSKLKARVEVLFADGLPLFIHCTVSSFRTKGFKFDEPRHWFQLGRGIGKQVIWLFPTPFIKPAKSTLGPELEYWEQGCGWGKSVVAEGLRTYLDRPRDQLMHPFDDPWQLAAILRAADRRLGGAVLLQWGAALTAAHPARLVLAARFGGSALPAGDQAEAA